MIRPWKLMHWLLFKLPKNSKFARLARAYLSYYRGDNNVWAGTNGEFTLLKFIAPKLNTIIDVGANVGDWSVMAYKFNSNLNIHCFEAAPDNFSILSCSELAKNAKLNHMAVADRGGSIILNIESDFSSMNSIVKNSNKDLRSISVEAITLDDYVIEQKIGHVDFVKIDVEGAEMLVLKGMNRLIKDGGVDAVQFEYGPFSIYARSFLLDFFELFSSAGFDMYKISSDKLLYFSHYNTLLDNFSHSNWVALRQGTNISDLIKSRSINAKII